MATMDPGWAELDLKEGVVGEPRVPGRRDPARPRSVVGECDEAKAGGLTLGATGGPTRVDRGGPRAGCILLKSMGHSDVRLGGKGRARRR